MFRILEAIDNYDPNILLEKKMNDRNRSISIALFIIIHRRWIYIPKSKDFQLPCYLTQGENDHC